MVKDLIIEQLNQSAIITLNHPPANTLTVAGLHELAGTIGRLNADGSIRSIVLTGGGDTFFSAGADLKQFATGDKAEADKVFDAFVAVLKAIRSFSGITVAAINGYALGGGLECALMCDYMVAERGAKLGLPEAKVGLIPAAGGTKTLADKVGRAWAKRMILGGEILSAEKAVDIGLVEELVDPGFAKIMAISLANKISTQEPAAVTAARALIEGSAEVSLEQHLKLERAAVRSLVGTEQQKEGVAAFLAKRCPSWANMDLDDN